MVSFMQDPTEEVKSLLKRRGCDVGHGVAVVSLLTEAKGALAGALPYAAYLCPYDLCGATFATPDSVNAHIARAKMSKDDTFHRDESSRTMRSEIMRFGIHSALDPPVAYADPTVRVAYSLFFILSY